MNWEEGGTDTSTTIQKPHLKQQYQEDRILCITSFKFNKLQLTILFNNIDTVENHL